MTADLLDRIVPPVLMPCLLFAACAPPSGDPGPGDASQAAIETWMNGEVFGSLPQDGLQWALAFYSPGEGEVCMAFGLVELDPGGGASYENLPAYTATVSVGNTGDGSDALTGDYYHYSAEYDSFSDSGSYVYNLPGRWVSVEDKIYSGVPRLDEVNVELTNDQIVSLLQPCHGFEASASPAPRGGSL